MEKRWWLYIDAFVHITIRANRALLYNSFSGKMIEFHDNPEILKLLTSLKTSRNNGIVLLTSTQVESKPIKEFISIIHELFMGDLIDIKQSQLKPVQMYPILNIQKDVVYLNKNKEFSAGENIMDYLKQITFFINDSCEEACASCLNVYQQTNCCYKPGNKKTELSIEQIQHVLQSTGNCLEHIGISGGDIFKYSKLLDLLALLYPLKIEKVLYLNYALLAKNPGQLKIFEKSQIQVDLSVFLPVVEKEFQKTWLTIKQNSIKVSFNFIIQQETDFQSAKTVIHMFELESYRFTPFYNGKNDRFFKENIFVNHTDITNNRPQMSDIYRNESINTNYFGNIWIKPDGRVYANLKETAIGHIERDHIKDLLIKALSHGKSWRKLRKNVLPCKKCTFQNLCPPISNLNKIIGQNNLCHMNDR